MSNRVEIYKSGPSDVPLLAAWWCESFFCRLRGLMFRRGLPDGLGLVLVERSEGVANTAIHMFAVPFPIGVLWVNNQNEVVDKVVAKPWRLYSPERPARYVVEGPPALVDEINVGEKIEFRQIPSK